MKGRERRGPRGGMRNTDKGKRGENGGLFNPNVSERDATRRSYQNEEEQEEIGGLKRVRSEIKG